MSFPRKREPIVPSLSQPIGWPVGLSAPGKRQFWILVCGGMTNDSRNFCKILNIA